MERRQERYAERYKDVLPEPIFSSITQGVLPFYYFVSGFAHPLLPIVKQDGIFLFEWGMIPAWVKDLDTAKDMQGKTLNAVGETVFEKPSFKKSIGSKRCLLGVSGFFEWRDVNKLKYPYFIHLKSVDLFSLGCIYESWVDRSTGEIRNTFSIVTTAANPLMEHIHNLKKRMPLIISMEDEQNWIDPDLPTQAITALIKPYPEADMTAYTVSKIANGSKNDRNVPEILEEVEYPELAKIQ
jgi:putative SOS response-associated peptidase YedK